MLALLGRVAADAAGREARRRSSAPRYDVEAINGVDWLMKDKGLKKGDKIGDLYFEGDYGEGGLNGVKYAAQKAGLKVVEQKIKATDTDMSGQVAAFKRAGVKAIWMTVGPQQLASAAGVAKATGLDVPIGGNGPVFSPTLLGTAVGPTLEKNLTVVRLDRADLLRQARDQEGGRAVQGRLPEGRRRRPPSPRASPRAS